MAQKTWTILLLICLLQFSLYGQTLVIPGDYPDPSVVKIGDTYWASATTSNWAPAFPLLSSKNLLTWQPHGYVFNTLPEWADYYFWAPEITYDNGKVFVYYSAHKRGGNLCLGIASADKPEGPYKDHGPIMCEEAGSIDAFPMRDVNGKLYLIWKEDGNSVNKPTPIWAMEMNEERTALTGEKIELFRNDKPWEGNLVEGVSMMKHGDYYYAFFAGAGCCGRECSYGVGVARSKALLGPWEKYPENPLLKSQAKWKCPGHGTPVAHKGKFYFLYHAYDATSTIYAGRQGVLSEFTFTSDGWITFKDVNSKKEPSPTLIEDNFNGKKLSPHWQWSVFQNVQYALNDGQLQLLSDTSGLTFIGQKIYSSNYVAEVTIYRTSSEAGIGLIGDDKNLISLMVSMDSIHVKKIQNGVERILASRPVPDQDSIRLRVDVKNGKDVMFLYQVSEKKFIAVSESPVDGQYLPPWDRAIRVGLISSGKSGQQSKFDRFKILYQK